MAAVRGGREQVEQAIAGIDGVVVANHNAPAQTVVSGSHAGMEAAMQALAKAGLGRRCCRSRPRSTPRW